MNEQPLVRLRRLLGEQWSPQWIPNEAIDKACDEIERLRAHRAEQVPLNWIPCAERLPEARYGHEGEPPYVSDDVLIRYSDGLVEMANYDHEEHFWTIVTTLRQAFEPPEHWMPVPSLLPHSGEGKT